MTAFPEFGLLRWIFGPLWFLGMPLSLGVTIAWVIRRVRTRLKAKTATATVAAQSSSPAHPPVKKHALTPVQIGACVGATVTLFLLIVIRELSGSIVAHGEDGGGSLLNLLMGVWIGIGALAGMAIVALVRMVRRR
jgi:hypothetical protein